jgi:hypothetical protein
LRHKEQIVAGSNGQVGRREAMRALLSAVPVAAAAAAAAPLASHLELQQRHRSGGPSGGSEPGAGHDLEGAPADGLPSGTGTSSAGTRPRVGLAPRPFDDLPGTRVGRCKVVRVDPVLAGAVPFTLAAPDGVEFRVDVVRHDAETPGVARAGSLAVFMNNGGTGTNPTVEEHGLGAMALAVVLERLEAGGRPVPELVTFRQRVPLLAALDG